MLYAPRTVSPASLSNTDNAANIATIPAGSAIANIDAGTLLLWMYTTTTANAVRSVIGKSVTNGGWEAFKRGVDGTVLRFARYRPSGDLTIDAPSGTLVANTWQYLAISWDIASAANCRMVVGTLSTAARDVSATVSVGAGSPASDSAQIASLLNNVLTTSGWPGSMAAFGIVRRVLPVNEMQAAQFRDWRRLGCAGLWYPGRHGPSDLVRDESGNGNHATNTGLTLGAPCAGAKRQSLSTRGLAFGALPLPTPWPFRPLFFG